MAALLKSSARGYYYAGERACTHDITAGRCQSRGTSVRGRGERANLPRTRTHIRSPQGGNSGPEEGKSPLSKHHLSKVCIYVVVTTLLINRWVQVSGKSKAKGVMTEQWLPWSIYEMIDYLEHLETIFEYLLVISCYNLPLCVCDVMSNQRIV